MVKLLIGSEHYVYRSDGRIYVHASGTGEESIVFLHAVGRSGWHWRNVVDRFGENFTCYNIDLPGYDHSDIPPRGYSIDGDYPRAVLDVMDSMGLKNANIVAERTGALIAAILAAQCPERVHRLVLSGMPFWDKEQGETVWRKFFIPMFTDTESYGIPVAPLVNWEEAKEHTPGLKFEDWKKTEEIKQRSRVWSRLGQREHTSFDITSIGDKITQPTLLMYGERDPLRRGEKKAHESIRGSILKVIPGISGSLHDGKPDDFFNIAFEFLRRSY
jgi:pimeloyl-ACP methyl ester carboxylesterase